MNSYMAAHTKCDTTYPGYINFSRDDAGAIVVTVRGDPKVVDGCYVCGHASDKGKPGRCTPGDDNCNNYCNMAPEKGPMVDHPKDCQQIICGETVTVRLSPDELRALLDELAKEV